MFYTLHKGNENPPNFYIASVPDPECSDSKGYLEVTTRIRQIVYNQKFEGAASGFLNPNIIARDLGMVDKQELEVKGMLTEEEREKRIKALEGKMKDS